MPCFAQNFIFTYIIEYLDISSPFLTNIKLFLLQAVVGAHSVRANLTLRETRHSHYGAMPLAPQRAPLNKEEEMPTPADLAPFLFLPGFLGKDVVLQRCPKAFLLLRKTLETEEI